MQEKEREELRKKQEKKKEAIRKYAGHPEAGKVKLAEEIQKEKVGETFRELEKTCYILMSFGIHDIFDRTYSQFKIALEALHERVKIEGTALAYGISLLFGEKKSH